LVLHWFGEILHVSYDRQYSFNIAILRQSDACETFGITCSTAELCSSIKLDLLSHGYTFYTGQTVQFLCNVSSVASDAIKNIYNNDRRELPQQRRVQMENMDYNSIIYILIVHTKMKHVACSRFERNLIYNCLHNFLDNI
jgi:hypothetical protein